MDAKTLHDETSLLRRRLACGVGLILGMFAAFLFGGFPGAAAFFVFAAAASVLAYLVGQRSSRG